VLSDIGVGRWRPTGWSGTNLRDFLGNLLPTLVTLGYQGVLTFLLGVVRVASSELAFLIFSFASSKRRSHSCLTDMVVSTNSMAMSRVTCYTKRR
jgi:hypothetical protein